MQVRSNNTVDSSQQPTPNSSVSTAITAAVADAKTQLPSPPVAPVTVTATASASKSESAAPESIKSTASAAAPATRVPATQSTTSSNTSSTTNVIAGSSSKSEVVSLKTCSVRLPIEGRSRDVFYKNIVHTFEQTIQRAMKDYKGGELRVEIPDTDLDSALFDGVCVIQSALARKYGSRVRSGLRHDLCQGGQLRCLVISEEKVRLMKAVRKGKKIPVISVTGPDTRDQDELKQAIITSFKYAISQRTSKNQDIQLVFPTPHQEDVRRLNSVFAKFEADNRPLRIRNYDNRVSENISSITLAFEVHYGQRDGSHRNMVEHFAQACGIPSTPRRVSSNVTPAFFGPADASATTTTAPTAAATAAAAAAAAASPAPGSSSSR